MFFFFFLKTNDRKASKVNLSLVICPNGNSKQVLYSLNKKFFNDKKIPYLRKKNLKDKLLGRQRVLSWNSVENGSVREVECALRHKDTNFVLLDFTVAINIFC